MRDRPVLTQARIARTEIANLPMRLAPFFVLASFQEANPERREEWFSIQARKRKVRDCLFLTQARIMRTGNRKPSHAIST